MNNNSKRYWAKIITYVLLLIVVMISSVILIAKVPSLWPIGFIVWLVVIVGGGSYLLLRWHAKNTAYICPKCGHKFIIPTVIDLLSPHIWDEKLLRCPACGESSWCKGVSLESIKEGIIRVEEQKKVKAKPTMSLYIQIGIVMLLYLVLWIHTVYLYQKLPETIATNFDFTGEPGNWGNKSNLFIIPLVATIFPILHGIICIFAAKHGYKSSVYIMLTAIFAIFLLFFMGIQYLI